MSGIKTNTVNLVKSFEKWKAQDGADTRKANAIEEFRLEFIRQGCSALEAHSKAIEKYNSIHHDKVSNGKDL